MIGRLCGKAVGLPGEDTVVLDVGGVGYELLVPLGTLGRAGIDAEGRTTLFVHTHVREDALTLFGFAAEADRVAFRTLIGVSNVGPKMALAVLSALPTNELSRTIAQKDLGRLTSIPGVGKKTAERLVLELRDKLVVAPVDAASGGGTTGQAPSTAHAGDARTKDLLLGALTRLGYRAAEAERAIQLLGDRVDREILSDLVKDALALLAK